MAPVAISSRRARVTKVWGTGLEKDDNNVDKFTVSILMVEKPGQPIRLTAKDELARQLQQITDENLCFSFEANLAGNPIPYLFATSIDAIPSEDPGEYTHPR